MFQLMSVLLLNILNFPWN